MKIVDTRKKTTRFAELKAGDVFVYDDEICMKMRAVSAGEGSYGDIVANAIELVEADRRIFTADTPTQKVEAFLTIGEQPWESKTNERERR